MKSFKTSIFSLALSLPFWLTAQVTLEKEILITENALYFDGKQVSSDDVPNSSTGYDYFFGRDISATGDCISTYKHFVFLTWYKGGKENRQMMLTRLNLETGVKKTIEFPNRHTGYRNVWWIGESHNYISVAVSPIDGTIHLLYDMHAYSSFRPEDGSLKDDYFRYSFSKKMAAEVSDENFTIDQFVKDTDGDYKHLSLNGVINHDKFSEYTYPQFFTNDRGDLFFSMRKGSSPNGGYHYARYDASTSKWSEFIKFADKDASKHPNQEYNWGMYGRFKYLNGKIRIGFQRRLQNTEDKYLYQNGFYYAYSDDQTGQTSWKNYKGVGFTTPLQYSDQILVYEPGDLVSTTKKDQVNMVAGFDWTVTDRGDIHIIGKVKDEENNVTKFVHTYKTENDKEFTTSTSFSGGEQLYTSGNQVFNIGINTSFNVFIESTEGGTNKFKEVYNVKTGRRFRQGTPYVSNGKLYYYMTELSTTRGDKQHLYLQIIYLGIKKAPFSVTLTSPVNNEAYDVGKTVKIAADAVDENGSISMVKFLLNGVTLGEDATSPYAIDWKPSTAGSYTIKAIAYNAKLDSTLSPEIKVNFHVFDPNDLTGAIYRIKNFATKKYMHSVGSDVVQSDNGINVADGDKEWEIVKSGVNYNIVSKRSDRGVLRAAGSPLGEIISTAFPAPNTDTDKLWFVIYDKTDNTYRFKTFVGDRYLTHSANGLIEYNSVLDDRSKWLVESGVFSSLNNELNPTSINIYPNPTDDKFTIAFIGFRNARVIITDVLGKIFYEKKTEGERLELSKADGFTSGLYIIQIADETGLKASNKLMIK